MKYLISFVLVIAFLFSCTTTEFAGNVIDVNNGSILGKLVNGQGEKITDSVTVELYKVDDEDGLAKQRSVSDTLMESIVSDSGGYEFDSLPAGTYRIDVLNQGIIVGNKNNIKVETDSPPVEVTITVVIIINQTFNISIDNSQNITINNFTINNGTVVKTDSVFILTTAESDTIYFQVEVEKDGKMSTVTVRIIRNDDGTATYEIVENEDEVKITIISKDGPTTVDLGNITIEIQEPGTITVESSFDTTEAP